MAAAAAARLSVRAMGPARLARLSNPRALCMAAAAVPPPRDGADAGSAPEKCFSANASAHRAGHRVALRAQSGAASERPAASHGGFLSENVIDSGGRPAALSAGTSAAEQSEASGSAPAFASSSGKSRRMCYYHSQGLCTMMEDAAHLSKFSHEFPNFSAREEDKSKVKAQPFDRFLVLDLEGMVEILEFPVVMIDAKTLQIVDHFHRFVRPAKMKEDRIVDYIRNKYGRWGLDRVWHDTAIPFIDLLPEFEAWLERHGLWDPRNRDKTLPAAAFVTCGNWDIKTKIPEQCCTSEIDLPVYFNEWINLKDVYFNFYKFRASGMLAMMKGLKLPMTGTHHVGLDDAINIARVLQRMLVHGALMQITASRRAGDPKSVKFAFRFRIK